MSTRFPGGWHRDPWQIAYWRYWDGSVWTGFTAPETPPQVVPVAAPPPPRAGFLRRTAYKAWLVFSDVGQARQAYERGGASFEISLEVSSPSRDRVLREVEAEGWRLTGSRLLPRVTKTHVTPNSDGTHTVEKSWTQREAFYFVRRN